MNAITNVLIVIVVELAVIVGLLARLIDATRGRQ